MGAVFISYRRGDSEGQARALSLELEELLGKDQVFMDVDSIGLGRDFRQVLQESLQACDILLALIGPNWLDSKDAAGNRRLENSGDFVRQEIGAALKRNISVTPVLLQGATMPPPDRLPEDLQDLAYRNGFELSHTRWESDVHELVKRLGLATSAGPDSSRPATPPPHSWHDAAAPSAQQPAPAKLSPRSVDVPASPAATAPSGRPRKLVVPLIAAGVAIVVIIAVLAWMGRSRGPAAAPASFDPIVAGVNQIALGEKGVAGPVAPTADGWVAIASADGSVSSPKAFVLARQYEAGRVAAFGHPGFLYLADTHPDNALFIANLMRWLSAGKGQRACFTVGQGEPQIGEAGTRSAINIHGFEIQTITGTVSPYTISGCSAVVINDRRASAFTSDEVQTLRDYVAKGNGLLLGGLGWSYAAYGPTKNIQDYPMLQVGRVFGVEWPTSNLGSPDAQGLTTFRTFYPAATP